MDKNNGFMYVIAPKGSIIQYYNWKCDTSQILSLILLPKQIHKINSWSQSYDEGISNYNSFIFPVLRTCANTRSRGKTVDKVTRLVEFLPLLFSVWTVVWKIARIAQVFPRKKSCINFDINWVWLHFGRFFQKLFWTPWLWNMSLFRLDCPDYSNCFGKSTPCIPS
jgi:hypothetical protein